MKETDIASTAGLAALAVCDALLKELHRKNLLSEKEIQDTLDTAITEVESKGDKGGLAAKMISHLREIFS